MIRHQAECMNFNEWSAYILRLKFTKTVIGTYVIYIIKNIEVVYKPNIIRIFKERNFFIYPTINKMIELHTNYHIKYGHAVSIFQKRDENYSYQRFKK